MTAPLEIRPRVSIVIPAFERVEALCKSLAELSKQDLTQCEVIVVDDFSSNANVRLTCERFPFAHYHRTPRNLGVIGARNHGYGLTRGDIIVNLDDDSYFVTPDAVSYILRVFDGYPRVGILAFNIELLSGARSQVEGPLRGAHTYTGCGNAWTRQLLTEVGAYSPLFWRQGDELDHSMRAIDAGFEIVLAPEIVVRHEESAVGRDVRFNRTLELANHLKRTLLRVPTSRIPEYLARWLVLAVIWFPSYKPSVLWSELGHPERGLMSVIRARRSLSPCGFVRWLRMKSQAA